MQVRWHLEFLCFTLTLYSTTAYRTDISSKGEERFCEHRKHLTFKPDATCCANKALKVGLNIGAHWKACINEGGKSDTLEGIGWDVYSCILKKESGKDKLSLQEFADLITKHYPDDIKSKINAEIQTQSIPSASISNYGRLEKLRVTYYDIEKEVCEGMPSATKSYGKIEMCSSWKEENHRNGMCCKTSYPVDIRYKSIFDLNDAKTIEKCRSKMHQALVNKQMNATDLMENTLLEMCDVVCHLDLDLGSIMDNREYHNFKIDNFVGVIPTNFLHPTMVQGIKEFLLLNETFNLNATIQDMKDFKFADILPWESHTERTMHTLTYVHVRTNKTVEKFESEFMGRPFHRGILHVPIQCTIYKQVVTQAERYLFQNCKPEDVTEAPAPAEEKKPEPEPEPGTEKPQAESTDSSATTDAS